MLRFKNGSQNTKRNIDSLSYDWVLFLSWRINKVVEWHELSVKCVSTSVKIRSRLSRRLDIRDREVELKQNVAVIIYQRKSLASLTTYLSAENFNCCVKIGRSAPSKSKILKLESSILKYFLQLSCGQSLYDLLEAFFRLLIFFPRFHIWNNKSGIASLTWNKYRQRMRLRVLFNSDKY